MRNEDVELRIPDEYRQEYTLGELNYTRSATNQFWEASERDSLIDTSKWRKIVLQQRIEFYEHWFATGIILSPEDTSV